MIILLLLCILASTLLVLLSRMHIHNGHYIFSYYSSRRVCILQARCTLTCICIRVVLDNMHTSYECAVCIPPYAAFDALTFLVPTILRTKDEQNLPLLACCFRLSFPNYVRIKYKGDSVTQPFISMHTLVRARIIYGILSNALFIFLPLHLYHRSLTFWFL